MQLLIDLENDLVADKIIKILEIFKNDGVKIKKMSDKQLDNKVKVDSKVLHSYDIDYEKSFKYKLDRADFIEMKKSL